MPKSKTHFQQVPVEIARKVAEAESNGHSIDTLKPKKKSSNDIALAEPTPDEEDFGAQSLIPGPDRSGPQVWVADKFENG